MPDKGLKERSIRQLSGGERRRVALALALGYAQLATTRGQLRCNLLVLDEASRGFIACAEVCWRPACLRGCCVVELSSFSESLGCSMVGLNAGLLQMPCKPVSFVKLDKTSWHAASSVVM